jgi:GNAT superfamily N-acetyltransferase
MHVRSVPAVGLDRFVESGGDPAHHREVRRYLDAMFAAGSMRPEWCFVAEEHGGPVGRIAFWTLPGMEEPLALVLFDAPWREDHRGTGARLLGHALEEARALGAGGSNTSSTTRRCRPNSSTIPKNGSRCSRAPGSP